MFSLALAILGLAVLTATAAHAARPLETEDTGTLEPGQVEVELSLDYAGTSGRDDRAFKGVLNVGLWPRLEGRIESSVLVVDPDGADAQGGLADSLIGAKYRLIDETETRPAVMTAVALRLPTGNSTRGLGQPGVDVLVVGAVSKVLGPVALTGNALYTFVTDDRDLEFWTLASSIEYRAATAWTLVGEIVARLGTEDFADTAVLRAGGVFAVNDRVRMDGAVGVGLTRDSPDVLLTVGVTLGFY